MNTEMKLEQPVVETILENADLETVVSLYSSNKIFRAACGPEWWMKKIGCTRDDMNNMLRDCCKKGDYSTVLALVYAGANVDEKETYHGWTPLHIASKRKHLKIVKLLLDVGVNVDEKDWECMTSLHFASGKGHLEIVKVLLENGANINEKDDVGSTPLHYASNNGHLEIIKLLLDKGANVNEKDKYGMTPLQGATLQGHLEIVQLLLESGAKVYGFPTLYLADKHDHIDIVSFFSQ